MAHLLERARCCFSVKLSRTQRMNLSATSFPSRISLAASIGSVSVAPFFKFTTSAFRAGVVADGTDKVLEPGIVDQIVGKIGGIEPTQKRPGRSSNTPC